MSFVVVSITSANPRIPLSQSCSYHCEPYLSQVNRKLTHHQILPSFSQLKESYDRKSGEGLSLAFVIIWLAGDLLNLIGAWRQELLWTMVSLQ
jgi:hypothetical protein